MNREPFQQRTFAETLVAICRAEGGDLLKMGQPNTNALAKRLRTSQANAYRWTKGAVEAKSTAVDLVAKRFKITPAQARGETPIPWVDGEIGVGEKAAAYRTGTPRNLPVLTLDQVSRWTKSPDFLLHEAGHEHRFGTGREGPLAFMVRAIGDSMLNPHGTPSIPENSLITVDPEVDPETGKIVVVKLGRRHEATIKKLVIDGPNTYLKSLNPDYKPIQVTDEWEIVGVATRVEIDL